MGNRKRDSRSLALAAVLAALYAADVVFFAPISFQVVQIRVADVLLPLSMLFGPPAIAGLTLGTLIGNFYGSPFGPIDIVGGTLANFLATALAWYVGRRVFRGARETAVALQIAVISLVVGGYLSLPALTNTPVALSVLYVFAGEVVAVGFGGYPLMLAVSRALGRNSGKNL